MIAGIHIVKRLSWRGQPEEFENVYHYDVGTGPLTQSGWNDLVDAIVGFERPLHSSQVTFVRARVHGPTQATTASGVHDKAADVMQFAKDLSGVGSMVTTTQTAFEMAVVTRIYLGRSDKGYKQFLTKFYHSAGLTASTTTSGADKGNAALASGDKTPFVNAFNGLRQITIGTNANKMTNMWGKQIPTSENPIVLDYLHTRQFRRGPKRRSRALTNPG